MGRLPPAGLPVCFRSQRLTEGFTEAHREHGAGGGPCVRVKRTSGPGACRAWRASHATLWGRALTRTRPGAGDAGDSGDAGAPLRGVKETVVQSGDSRRPSSPIGPTASCYGTSQTCRGCRGKWKFGSLEVWRLGLLGGAPPHTPLLRPSPRRGALFTVLRSLFSGAR